MTESLRILHLCDTHLYGDGRLHYGIVDTLAALDRVLERAAELDSVDWSSRPATCPTTDRAESYRLLDDRSSRGPASAARPSSYAMGNHDLADGFEEVLGAARAGADGRRIPHRDRRHVRVPAPATDWSTANGCDGCADALAEPAPNAARSSCCTIRRSRPTTGLFETAAAGRSRRRCSKCARAGDVRLILAGHYHHALVTAAGASGIPVVVAPAVANTTDVLWPARPGARGARSRVRAASSCPRPAPVRAHFVAAPAPRRRRDGLRPGAAAVDRIAADAGWPGMSGRGAGGSSGAAR